MNQDKTIKGGDAEELRQANRFRRAGEAAGPAEATAVLKGLQINPADIGGSITSLVQAPATVK